jgi:hypothetical protein
MKTRLTSLSFLVPVFLAAGCAVGADSNGASPSEEATLSAREAVTIAASLSDAPPLGPISVNPGPILLDTSGIAFDAATGTVTITGTAGDDVASVGIVGSSVTVIMNQASKAYALGSVTNVVFRGNAGDDVFDNATSLKSSAYGGDGNDVLHGGSGDDFQEGGYGNDTLYGNGGNDVLWGSGEADEIHGGDGDDVIFGHGGNDVIYGDAGRDSLYGGSGNDQFHGGTGQDLIVAVGSGADTVTGDSQWDNYWLDTSDVLTDASPDEKSMGYVHTISAFYKVGSTAVGLEPLGEDLPDPAANPALSTVTANFAKDTLFAAGGPTKNDIFQGSTGDCYFLSPLSATADSDPEYIRRMVVSLGDGTYAVRFLRNGQPVYVRVDADLWVNGNGDPVYAKLGAEKSLWVPIVEKAFALFREDKATYDSISGGNGPVPLEDQLGATVTPYSSQGPTKEQVLAWYDSGSPAGTIKDEIHASVVDMLDWMNTQRTAGKEVITGSIAGVNDFTPLIIDGSNPTWHRGQHIYMVDHVEYDANKNPTALVLRNPYGSFDKLTDFTRIYFCIGGGARWDLP